MESNFFYQQHPAWRWSCYGCFFYLYGRWSERTEDVYQANVFDRGRLRFFQFVMPMMGWVCIHTIVVYFNAVDKIIPGIALILLIFCGSKMVIEGTKGDEGSETDLRLGTGTLMIQGVATSIDALSVGVTIADYCFFMALAASLIISVVTFLICVAGLIIGKKVGITLSKKAAIFGGIILICIGIEIFIRGVFF